MFSRKLLTLYIFVSLSVWTKEAWAGQYVSLASHLESQGDPGRQTSQSELIQRWTRDSELAAGKTVRLGSEESVYAGDDKGFFSVIQAAYNHHWVLKTRPEDWWTTISQTIATRIDRVAENPVVRKFFVSHKGKKTLTVDIGPSVSGINDESFFQKMISKISQNINKPEYTTLMQSDFSQSSSVDRVVNSIMLMYSFQEYFEYRANLACGIPGVIMEGTEEDWRMLVEKLEKVEKYLEPIKNTLKLERWFRTVKPILEKLVDTYNGEPDREWWSKIFDEKRSFGSGGGSTLSGWYTASFLGLGRSGDLRDVPSGVNVVPVTLTAPGHQEEAALAGGFTGYNVLTENVTDGTSNVTDTLNNVTSIQAVRGWALLMDPNSPLN